jgi:eukaryotic-like serine/threonine-protein kinase
MPNRPMYEGQLFGNYRLVRLLGRGGFAEVYLGRHIHIRRMAAIKLLLAQVDAPDIKHFKREAQIVADLHHPHIISLLDFGVHDGHIPYIAMEYAASGTLRQRHPRGSVIAPTQALAYMAQVAEALDFAHARSIIHRDVKPENMLLNAQDSLLLSDFGIATLTSELGAQITPSVAGTAVYMAPEQLRGKTRPESDQYALAVVTYEWLCGKPPFHGTYPEIAVQHINSAPPSLRTRNPRISPAIEEVVNIALAKDPAQRYPTVSEFVADFRLALRPARASHARTSYNDPAPVAPHSPLVSVPTQLTERVQSERDPNNKPAPTERRSVRPTYQKANSQPVPTGISRRTILLTLGGIALLGGVGGGVAWFTRSHTNEPLFGGSALSTTTAGTGRKTVGKNVAQGGSGTPSATNTPSTTSTNSVLIGTTLNEYHGHTKSVLALAWSPRDNNMIASGSLDKTVQIWNAFNSEVITNYGLHADQVNTVAWSPDGKLIASGSNDKQVQIWHPLTGEQIRFYSNHQDVVSSVAWSPNGQYIASGSFDKTVQVWNASTGGLIHFFEGHQDVVNSVAWSPNGQYVASGSSDKTVRVWQISTGGLIYTYTQHSDFVSSVLWSSTGKQIISASDDTSIQIWFAFTGANSYAYREHKGAIFTIALSPDGTQVASSSSDKTVKLWNFSNADTVYSYVKHMDNVIAVTWSPQGKQIASGGFDKIVRVWQAM